MTFKHQKPSKNKETKKKEKKAVSRLDTMIEACEASVSEAEAVLDYMSFLNLKS